MPLRSRMERNILKRHSRDVMDTLLNENGVYGFGLSHTFDRVARPHNSLLGKMPHQPDDDDDDDLDDDEITEKDSLSELISRMFKMMDDDIDF